MQPCPNCGRTEVTPAGNCQNCGMFRGNDAYGSGYGQAYPPPADPYSAAPYSGPPSDPYSAPPYQGQQGYQGQSYGQYQQPYQQAQPQYGYQDPNAYQAAPAPAAPAVDGAADRALGGGRDPRDRHRGRGARAGQRFGR